MAVYSRAFCEENPHRETVDCHLPRGVEDMDRPRHPDTTYHRHYFEQITSNTSEFDNLVAISNILNEHNKRHGVVYSANAYSTPTRQLNLAITSVATI